MVENYYVIQDDVSRYGLRRLHLMGKEKPGEEKVEETLGRLDEEGECATRRLTAYATRWQDEVGNWHLYMAWREMMETMVVANGMKFCEALVQASGGYFRRFGRVPNRVMVREGSAAPEMVQLEADGMQVRARVRRCHWLRANDVGVYVDDGDDLDGAGGGVEMQERACDGGGGADGQRRGEPAAVPGGA